MLHDCSGRDRQELFVCVTVYVSYDCSGRDRQELFVRVTVYDMILSVP